MGRGVKFARLCNGLKNFGKIQRKKKMRNGNKMKNVIKSTFHIREKFK